VARAGAADIAVLKVAPLGGVRAMLDIAARIDLPVVVSSALDSAVGIGAGLRAAAALPRLEHACGLVDDTRAAFRAADLAAAGPRRDWWIDRVRRCLPLLTSRP